MAINKIPESQLPTRSVSETDYVRVVGADGKSYRVPKTDFNGGGGGGALTQDTKQALLQCFAHTAWTDDQGQDYYDDLEDALYPFDLLSSITAVYTQSGTVYDTDSLDSLKADLVVTGNYSDGTYNQTTKYTLSGMLTVGTSTITATYGGKTATFTVTVTQSSAVLTSISAVYTQSGTVYTTDSLDSLKSDLVVTAHYSDSSTSTVASSDYTLSGTLTVGTSTVTVSYGGKTTTFNVTVTQAQSGVLGYVDTGLIMLLDGIANSTGGTHESTITDLIDQSGNGYDWETGTGTVTATEKALVFNGSSSLYGKSSWATPALTTPKTVEVVVDVTSPSTTQCVVCGVDVVKDASNATPHGTVSVKSSNLLNYEGGTNGNIPITSGVHTYSFVNESGTWKAYKDGTLVTSGNTTVSWKSGYKTMGRFRGASGNDNGYGFTGKLYSYRVYSSALSASDIASNYANDVTRFS